MRYGHFTRRVPLGLTHAFRDMKLVYEECLPILDAGCTSKTKLQKLKYTFDTWKKRKEVEKQIRKLKDEANKCYRRFTVRTLWLAITTMVA